MSAMLGGDWCAAAPGGPGRQHARARRTSVAGPGTGRGTCRADRSETHRCAVVPSAVEGAITRVVAAVMESPRLHDRKTYPHR